MQEKMVQELGIDPVEKEVVIVYQGEKQEHGDEFFQVLFVFLINTIFNTANSYASLYISVLFLT